MPMSPLSKSIPDLEIRVQGTAVASSEIELRFTDPQSQTDARQSGTAQFDLDHLHQLILDPIAYGQVLTDGLFADSTIREKFAYARGLAGSHPLRIRLVISESLSPLHSLRWETLRDPEFGTPFLTSEHTYFSRYLSSSNWKRITLRPRKQLRALVVVANPTNLNDYTPNDEPLAPIDVDGEIARAKSALGDIPMTIIASQPSLPNSDKPTLTTIANHLREEYDILFLIAHGAMLRGVPHIWLEDEHGSADVTTGEEIATHIQELSYQPRLVVLASCQSAGDTEGETRTALGPILAEAGVPAVIAMQGNISMQTSAAFMPEFFKELQRDGIIDRAIAVARGSVHKRHDWWMPILFLRLQNGQLWKDDDENTIKQFLTQAIVSYQSHLQETLLYELDVDHPYQSLYAFQIEDAACFFGRSTAIDQLYERILAHRLTIFHARSGAGKTSLINAGLVPRLIRKRYLPITVRTFDQPIRSLQRFLATYSPNGWRDVYESLSLHQLLHLICRNMKRLNELVIIFDQFEEFFTMTTDKEQRNIFGDDLAQCCSDSTLPVRFVLSLRGDYLSDLADFESHIPHIFHHQYRLEPMSRNEAQEAIEAPLTLQRHPVTYEPSLVEQLLQDLEGSGMELPHLQIICTALYDELPANESCITLSQYHQQGESAQILGDYLRREVEHLGEYTTLARMILLEMVSPQNTRQSRSLEHLQNALLQRSDMHALKQVLTRLVTARIVQRHEQEGSIRYELAHDYLVQEIRAWVTPEDLIARRAHEILQQGVANWYAHQWLIDKEPLSFIYEQREHITNLGSDEIELLLRSAVHHQTAVDTWAQIAHHYGIDIQPLLTPLLTATNHQTRAHVIRVLPIMGARVLQVLILALSDPSPVVRVQAIKALEQLDEQESHHILQHALVYEVAIPTSKGTPCFYIDRYPIRNAEYQLFLADHPEHACPPSWFYRTAPQGFEDHPVTGISWYEASAYAEWAGKRLPHATEWMQAAGGDNNSYPWGKDFRLDNCNTYESLLGTTTPVNRYSPNGDSSYGVADMAGNVWEWLADYAGPDESYRQLRGGSWMYSAEFARIDFALCWREPDQRQETIGFRLCFDSLWSKLEREEKES